MKIAIDISPLESEHKVRGTGFYVKNLLESLKKHYYSHTYLSFNQSEKLSENVDLIHYPYFEPFFLTLPHANRFPTVVTVHDLTPLVFPEHFPAGLKGSVKWFLQKRALKNADAIITDSEASKSDIVRLTGIGREKISVVYLAANEAFTKTEDKRKIRELHKKYDLPEKFVLYVGDVTWNKNIPRLIEAIKQINLTIVMVGKALNEKNIDENNPWNKDLVEYKKLSKNDKRIIQLGFVPTEDLVLLYNAARVTIIPSLYEGFGLPVLEAMSCGSPVITTKGGSLAEVAGDAAWYINPYNITAMANGIGEVYFSDKLQADLSKKGIAQAKRFTWKETAKKTLAVYKGVIK